MLKAILKLDLEEGSQMNVLVEERENCHYPMMLRTNDIVSGESMDFWLTTAEIKVLAAALLQADGESEDTK
jgi:hypothetical protein